MGHKKNKEDWDNLPQKERERLLRNYVGFGKPPSQINGTDIDVIMRNYTPITNEKVEEKSDFTIGGDSSTGGVIPL
jgi:hypothetical protein